MDTRLARFQARLDETLQYPALFLFKFIVPKSGMNELVQIFGSHPFITRPSSQGNYLGITAEIKMNSSDEILSIYRAASEIKGIIML